MNWVQKFEDWERLNPLEKDEKEAIELVSQLSSDNVQTKKSEEQKNFQQEYNEVTPITKKDEPIESTQQFLTWFSEIESEMEKGQEDTFANYLETASLVIQHHSNIIQKIKQSQNILDALKLKFDFVISKTSGLENQCEQMLDQQAHLISAAEDISNKLSYYAELESISKILNQPGEDLVLSQNFIPILKKLDKSIAFVKDHPKYKDSGIYLAKYRQLMTRSMTLIKLYFVESIRHLQAEVQEKLKETPDPPSNLQLQLFYIKFKALGSKIKYLIIELESRCEGHKEYYSLLSDCTGAYISVRKNILNNQISMNLRAKNMNTTMVQFASAGCAYMMGVCRDEFNLYREFFSLGDDDLSNVLSFALKPIIFREYRIEALSELCESLLYMMNPNPTEDNDFNFTSSMKSQSPGGSGTIKFVVETILRDAQTRLIYRAGDIIQEDIRQFNPRDQELLILARGPGLPLPIAASTLSMENFLEPQGTMPQASLSPKIERALTSTEHFVDESTLGGGEWYPALQRTMNLLSKIYGCLPSASFDDLAQDCVEACRISIISASAKLKTHQSLADGQLFEIKNLMQLREHISGFDSNLTRQSRNIQLLDVFSALKEVIVNPLELQNYENLTRPFQEVKNDDIRLGLDNDLKKACEEFILDTAKSCTNPILAYLKAHKTFSSEVKEDFKEKVLKANIDALECIKNNLGHPIQMLKMYFGDKHIQLSLIKIIRKTILNQFIEFVEHSHIKCGKAIREEIADEKTVSGILDSIFEGALE